MKRGFTLVELLAVILILSLLTTLAINSVTKIVRNSKEKIYASQIKAIEVATESWVSDNLDKLSKENSCSYITLGRLQRYGLIENNIKDPRNNSIIPSSTKIKIIYTGGSGTLTSYKYEVSNDVEDCTLIPYYYSNGEEVYFDVALGTSCTEEEYKKSLGTYETYIWDDDSEELVLREIKDYGNSKSGYNGIDNKDEHQNSCLKFYAFLDDEESESVNLILDHNVAISYWTDSDYNVDGPLTALSALEDATDDWEGTLEIENYNNEYTIDYSTYKARLITASEVAEIVGNKTFNEQTSGGGNWFYFDTLGKNENEIYNKEPSFYKYGWLYDRLNVEDDIKKYGIPNIEINASDYSKEYWTSVATSDNEFFAWYVSLDILDAELVSEIQLGIRPVIEVLKSNLEA